MIQLNFPKYSFKLKKNDENNIIIFDAFRKKWVSCTPEEWVRQNVLTYLTNDLNYPKSLLAIEKQLEIANRKFRFDALIYDKEFNPFLIIECKAPEVKITQDSFDQICTYNYLVKAPYLLVTNGLFHVKCKMFKNGNYKFIKEIPSY